ncbi:hypothetical protein RRG08_018496 [Elysia crispata]|uniref:Uncharacterized protein n=1 Tax=Elysia crispata TaxID=231223 RepID=A0AAE1CRX0_9GAST|nr:hypothetical protein RRG08_018496 [Elysia crispata]
MASCLLLSSKKTQQGQNVSVTLNFSEFLMLKAIFVLLVFFKRAENAGESRGNRAMQTWAATTSISTPGQASIILCVSSMLSCPLIAGEHEVVYCQPNTAQTFSYAESFWQKQAHSSSPQINWVIYLRKRTIFGK